MRHAATTRCESCRRGLSMQPHRLRRLFLLAESLGGPVLLRALITRAVAPHVMVLCVPVVRVAPEGLPPPAVVALVLKRTQASSPHTPAAGRQRRGTPRSAPRLAPPPWLRVAGGPAGRVRLAVAAVFLSTTASSAAALQRVAPSVPLVLHGDADVRTTARIARSWCGARPDLKKRRASSATRATSFPGHARPSRATWWPG